MIFIAIHARLEGIRIWRKLLHLEHVAAERHIAQAAQDFHRAHKECAAAVHVSLDGVLFLRTQRRVLHVNAIGNAPDHDLKRPQVSDLG